MAKKKRTVHATYDWDRWFKRKTLRLVQYADFDCAVHGMASQIRNKAAQRGLKVSLSIDGGLITVVIKNGTAE